MGVVRVWLTQYNVVGSMLPGLFGFLRVDEMIVLSDLSFDPSVHLSESDMAVDEPAATSVMRVSIKQSKVDPFCQGVDLFMSNTATDLCQVAVLFNYTVVRGPGASPLFQ